MSRNITVAGHRTSVRLEPEMWSGLIEIGRREHATIHEVCSVIARHKPPLTSLTAAIRVFVMTYYRVAATEEGHARIGHGNGVAVLMTPAANAGMTSPTIIGKAIPGNGLSPAYGEPRRTSSPFR